MKWSLAMTKPLTFKISYGFGTNVTTDIERWHVVWPWPNLWHLKHPNGFGTNVTTDIERWHGVWPWPHVVWPHPNGFGTNVTTDIERWHVVWPWPNLWHLKHPNGFGTNVTTDIERWHVVWPWPNLWHLKHPNGFGHFEISNRHRLLGWFVERQDQNIRRNKVIISTNLDSLNCCHTVWWQVFNNSITNTFQIFQLHDSFWWIHWSMRWYLEGDVRQDCRLTKQW